MCGIACILGKKISGWRQSLFNFSEITKTLAPRGPDDSGEFVDEIVKIMHSRLAIIDTSENSAQPFIGKRWVLAYNGEIFNFRALRQRLVSEGVTFSSNGDTEVLFQSIERWGVQQALHALAGMFAFVAYDRFNRELWVARDRLGIKPLFFTIDHEFIAFASWPSTLLRGIRKQWKLDRLGVHRLFQLGAVYGGCTLVDGIKEVPPAEVWCVDADLNIKRTRYWSPRLRRSSFDREEFADLFENVVAEHCEADVPWGLFLSGGVDSTSLAAAMEHGHAFHLRSEELPFAEDAAAECGLSFTCAEVGDVHCWGERLKSFSWVTGGAFAAIKQPYTLSRSVAEHDFRVALSANGADELYLGYARTPANDLPAEVFDQLPGFEARPADGFEAQVRHIFTSGANLASRVTGNRDAAARDAELLRDCERHLESCLERAGPHAAHRLFELETYVAADLNPNLDHASMYWGIEMRVPFLDHRIVEHALALDSTALVTREFGRKTPLKWYLSYKNVPSRIWNRRKVGFSLTMRDRARYRDDSLNCLVKLARDGILEFLPRQGYIARDFSRCLASARAFHAWKQAWIDAGVVGL